MYGYVRLTRHLGFGVAAFRKLVITGSTGLRIDLSVRRNRHVYTVFQVFLSCGSGIDV
jgi:hypothetical protein